MCFFEVHFMCFIFQPFHFISFFLFLSTNNILSCVVLVFVLFLKHRVSSHFSSHRDALASRSRQHRVWSKDRRQSHGSTERPRSMDRGGSVFRVEFFGAVSVQSAEVSVFVVGTGDSFGATMYSTAVLVVSVAAYCCCCCFFFDRCGVMWCGVYDVICCDLIY